jgi:hypothetical protein
MMFAFRVRTTVAVVVAMAMVPPLLHAGDAKARNAIPSDLASSREIYDVSLAHTSGYLLSARGRTVVETHGNCRGGTRTLQRSLSDVTYKDGQPMRTDFVIDTWESRDGRTLRFHVSNTQTGYGTEKHDGTAQLAPDGTGKVSFTSHDKPFALPRGTAFPGSFSRALLDAANKGHDLANRMVFQGGGSSALVTAAAKIGAKQSGAHELAKDPNHLLRGMSAWPILISYFPTEGELPASEVAAHLYSNGLLGSLSLGYPQFSLRAKLVRVERLKSSC